MAILHSAHEIMSVINAPNLFIQFDLFHAAQLATLTPIEVTKWKDSIGWSNNTSKIKTMCSGHIQVAQVPARGEPDTEGTVDYSVWFEWMKVR